MKTLRAMAANSPANGAILRAFKEHGELSVAAMRALSPLTDKAQIFVDKVVVEVGLQRLTFVADLINMGLTFPLSDPLGTPLLEWESRNKTGGAQRTMNPSARGENQLTDFSLNRLPIYLTTDDFSLGIRTLKASEKSGFPLDSGLISQATRRVNESIEDAAINGATTSDGQPLAVTSQGGQYSAPGLLNAPNANQYTLTTQWDDPTAMAAFTLGGIVLNDVMAMIAKNQAAKKFGPYYLYVGTRYGNGLDSDFKQNTMGTIKQRLLQIETIKGVRTADFLPYGKAVLVQMTDDVIQIVDGQQPTVIPWTSLDGFTLNWLILAIQVPRVRCDYDGNSGVTIATKV